MTAFLSILVLAASPLAAPSALSAPALCSTAPALCASAPAPAAPPNSARSVATKSLCTADCGQFNSNVSCSGTVCDAVNQSCPGEQGHVTCDGQTYYCAPCCTDGQLKTVITGPTCGCEDGQSTPRDRYKCINGEWVYQCVIDVHAAEGQPVPALRASDDVRAFLVAEADLGLRALLSQLDLELVIIVPALVGPGMER